jgi:hypothetical protein
LQASVGIVDQRLQPERHQPQMKRASLRQRRSPSKCSLSKLVSTLPDHLNDIYGRMTSTMYFFTKVSQTLKRSQTSTPALVWIVRRLMRQACPHVDPRERAGLHAESLCLVSEPVEVVFVKSECNCLLRAHGLKSSTCDAECIILHMGDGYGRLVRDGELVVLDTSRIIDGTHHGKTDPGLAVIAPPCWLSL